MRIGVFGGTFDPVHQGHLILAEQCRAQAALDQVRFIPAARPPHKQDQPLAAFAHRVEMLTLAVAGNPAFVIDELEKDRPGPSFTVDTLQALHRTFPQAELKLLVGSDCLPDLVHWREPARIGELAELLVVARPGWPVEGIAELPRGLRIQTVVQAPLVDIASHDLRARIAAGRSIRYLVPRAVECYVQAHQLYRTKVGP